MKARVPDTLWAGLLGGVLSAVAGYILFGSAWGWTQGESLAYFHREVFLGSPLYKDRIISICVLSIVPAFHLAYRREKDRFARGTLLVMILMVLYIVFLQYGE
jgi:hypothetical protein